MRFPLVYEMVLDARIAVSDEIAPDKDAAWIQSIVDSRHQYRFPVEWDVVKDQITEDAVKCGFWRELRDFLTNECEPRQAEKPLQLWRSFLRMLPRR